MKHAQPTGFAPKASGSINYNKRKVQTVTPLSPGRGGARAGAVDDLKLGTQSQKLQLHLQLSLGMRVVLCLVYILVQHGGERSDIIERRIL